MGLDYLELIMELEDQFDLSIPDEAVPQLTTVGATADYIIARLRAQGRTHWGCASARSFHALRFELMHRFRVARRDVRLTSTIGSLVPASGRRRWTRIAHEAGLREERNGLFRSPFPSPEVTLRELIATRGKVGIHPDGTVDEEAILNRIRHIVAEQAGVPLEQVSREAHYLGDLGMG